jgi:uncharacterized protein (DUF952 family)
LKEQGEAGKPDVAREQFERHGFVHCCTREQLTEVASWWFVGEHELVALEVDADEVGSDVRYEPSPTRWYPHIYAAIPTTAISATHDLPRLDDASVPLPAALADPPPAFHFVGRRDGHEVRAVWRGGSLTGDEDFLAAADRAITHHIPVPALGGVRAPASIATAYEAFCLLDLLADELVSYAGDGFFEG